MTIPEMITAVEENNITDELIDALVAFMWDFDPYGIMNEFGGAIEDDGVRDKVVGEINYALENDVNILLNDLRYARDECDDCYTRDY